MAAADLDQISHVIQLSVAPVFLLTGIGALLGVTTTRLSRIVDRARTIEVSSPMPAWRAASRSMKRSRR